MDRSTLITRAIAVDGVQLPRSRVSGQRLMACVTAGVTPGQSDPPKALESGHGFKAILIAVTTREAIYPFVKTLIDRGHASSSGHRISPFCQCDHPATCRLVGMADPDEGGKTESTQPILDEHKDVRRRFAELWNERTSGDAGAVDLAAAWQPVASMLEDHASAQDERADPVLPRDGHDDTSEEPVDSRPAEDERSVIRDFHEHSDETPLSRPEAQ